MIGIVNFRTYLFIGVGIGFACYVLGMVAGPMLNAQLTNVRWGAVNAGLAPVLADLITQPFIFAFSGDLVGAVVAGVLWPLAVVWIVLLVLALVFTLLGGGIGQVRDNTLF